MDPSAELIATVVGTLLGGAPVAEAVRAARSLLHRRHGIGVLAALRPELDGDGAAVLPARPVPADNALRQVTILSIDLVESTRLLAALGAERYSDVLTDYHRRTLEILRRHDGVPDQFQGNDGAMCYFGVPVAREDAASQSLNAALAVVASVQEIGLQLRIGVCTGELVIRDGQPIGPAVHLAARLQSIAAPGTVVVGESTRRIVRDRFRFEPLAPVVGLKGFDAAQACFRLLGAASASAADRAVDPSEPPAVPGLVPFVGRQPELDALQSHWAAVQRGSMRMVRLAGEAGIGKSRLVREFTRVLVAGGHEVLECRCAPEQVHSAFHPLIEALRSQLRINPGDAPERVLGRLRRLVSRADEIDLDSTALLVDLLGLHDPSGPRLQDPPTPERRRQRTIDLLVDLAEQRVRERAACLVIEDIHWMDPSTAEYLGRLAAATTGRRLMVIVTTRPVDEAARWHPRCPPPHLHETELQGFDPAMSRALVLATCGEHRLGADTVRLIAERADGVPLFIEESTRMAVEHAAAHGAPAVGAASPAGVLPAGLAVPATILDLLTARLDALGSAKQIAQVGAAIGRDFDLALLQTVLEQAGSAIGAADALARLAALVRAGLLLARREGGETHFVFKHALLRDAAYRSLLERDRRPLHAVIATAIDEHFTERAERQPQVIAHHYTAAGRKPEALRHWERAVRQAASRSAHAETIGYLGSALAVLDGTEPGVERDRLELRLQLMLAARLLATHGYGAEQVEKVYARAMALAKALGDRAALVRVLLGFESYHFMRGDFANARRDALEAAAGAGNQPGVPRVQARWALANLAMHEGEMESAVQQMDGCRAELDALDPRPELVQDPGVMCLCYSAWSLWQLGFPDEALRRVVAVVRQSEERGHKFSLGASYGFRAAVQHFRGENREALASADHAIAICEPEGFSVWLAHARLMRGRIVAALGEVAPGLDAMREGYALWTASGAVVTTPFYLTMRAEGLALDGRPDDGLALLDEALGIVERTGERYYEAEIRRLTGRLTLAAAERRGLDRREEAAVWMQQALERAGARRLASLSLRAAIDLYDLEAGEPARRRLAWGRLQDAHDAIIGGAGTLDLRAAQARLTAGTPVDRTSAGPARDILPAG